MVSYQRYNSHSMLLLRVINSVFDIFNYSSQENLWDLNTLLNNNFTIICLVSTKYYSHLNVVIQWAYPILIATQQPLYTWMPITTCTIKLTLRFNKTKHKVIEINYRLNSKDFTFAPTTTILLLTWWYPYLYWKGLHLDRSTKIIT